MPGKTNHFEQGMLKRPAANSQLNFHGFRRAEITKLLVPILKMREGILFSPFPIIEVNNQGYPTILFVFDFERQDSMRHKTIKQNQVALFK
jgi:hypothetical protein